MQKNRNSESGISIIELLVVLVVSAIIMTAAVYQYGNSKNVLARDKVALDFKTSLERARFDSIKRRATVANDMARVVINSSTSFTLRTDQNYDGTLQTNETRNVDFSQNTTSQITTTLNYPVTISFDYRGFITVVDAANNAIANPTFKICSQSCTTETTSNTTVITLSSTGTVINATGGYVAPTLQNPGVSNVATNQTINKLVQVTSTY